MSCAELVSAASAEGGAQLLQTLDFDVSEQIPASILNVSGRYIIFSTGCPLSANPTQIGDNLYCGNVNSAGVGQFQGDFHVFALQLDTSTPPPGLVNVQGLNATTDNNYFDFIQQVPYAYDMGLVYGDGGVPESGLLPDGSVTWLNGPLSGLDAGDPANGFPSDISNGPLFAPTAEQPLTGVSLLLQFRAAASPPDAAAWGYPGIDGYIPWDQILPLSNLTDGGPRGGVLHARDTGRRISFRSPTPMAD